MSLSNIKILMNLFGLKSQGLTKTGKKIEIRNHPGSPSTSFIISYGVSNSLTKDVELSIQILEWPDEWFLIFLVILFLRRGKKHH